MVAGYAGGETLHLKLCKMASHWCGTLYFVHCCRLVNVSLLGVDDCLLQPQSLRVLMPWCSLECHVLLPKFSLGIGHVRWHDRL
jgi:hypothetical protein